MQIAITTRNLELNESLRAYVENKVNRLDRYMPELDQVRVDLANHNTRSPQDSQVAQITLFGARGAVLRSEERSADLYSSIDAALDKMSRQIRHYKGKHYRSHNRHTGGTEPAVDQLEFAEAVEEEPVGEVVRVKRFETRPMDVEEAIEQMELLGHDFFAFYDVASGSFNVVYRRHGGGYGLLVPELA